MDSANLGEGNTNSDVLYDEVLANDTSVPSRDRRKKSERKVFKYENKILRMRSLRQKKKAERKLRLRQLCKVSNSNSLQLSANACSDGTDVTIHVNKHTKLAQIKDKLRSALNDGQRICIDLGMEKLMSNKECSRLAQQLGRVYGSNRKAEHPFHIYLTSVNKNSDLFKECIRKNCGFEQYAIDFIEQSVFEYFDSNSIIYLSPDADTALQKVEHSKIYVIGGLVDETRQKEVTKIQALKFGVRSSRLPIEKFCEKSSQGTFSQVLSINQVFEILLHVSATGDWKGAFTACLPKRLGFLPKKE